MVTKTVDTEGWVFAKHFRHWRTGRLIIAPAGKVFRFRPSIRRIQK